MKSIFLKETQGKETSTCPRGGQQVAENGDNERAVPTGAQTSVSRRLLSVTSSQSLPAQQQDA
jgi:hypothetical protein